MAFRAIFEEKTIFFVKCGWWKTDERYRVELEYAAATRCSLILWANDKDHTCLGQPNPKTLGHNACKTTNACLTGYNGI